MTTGVLALVILFAIVFQILMFTLIGIKQKAKLEVSENKTKTNSYRITSSFLYPVIFL